MFLTLQMLPIFAIIISALTFFIIEQKDLTDLNLYKSKMSNIPPMCCMIALLIPVTVLFTYDSVLKLGPKASKTGIPK